MSLIRNKVSCILFLGRFDLRWFFSFLFFVIRTAYLHKLLHEGVRELADGLLEVPEISISGSFVGVKT